MRRSLAVLASMVLALTLVACGGEEEDDPSAGGQCDYPSDGQQPAREVEAPPADPQYEGQVSATISTSLGEIPITLDAENAPCTVNSFGSLAEQGFFDNSPCPRITTEGLFVLQCGDPTGTTGGGPGYTFADELDGDEVYTGGTLAMANSGPDSNGSQFFIVYEDSQLAPDYNVFGTVDEAGLEVVREVAAAGSDNSNPAGGGTPLQPIDITAVTIEE